MSIIDNSLLLGAGTDGYQISRSLRFNSPDSAYLNRTPASAGNRKTWTWSGWVKRSAISGETRQMFGAYSSTTGDGLFFDSNEKAFFTLNGIGNIFVTNQVFRDPSAWYHFVLVFDSTSATTTINGGSTDRARFYINGSQVSAFSSTAVPSQNADCPFINTTNTHEIGRNIGSTQYFDGYFTEINFIDGQALTPSSFGETDTITGVWKPKKYTGTYGTNGFYLNFSDNSGTTSTTLGKDSSGNGNNWTPNNFSVTAGAGNDSMIDTPTPYADGGNGRGNYATWNPLKKNSGVSFSNGNLDFSGPGSAYPVFGNIAMTTGKWYWENLVNSNDGGDYPQFGVVDLSADENNSSNLGAFRAIAYRRGGVIRKEGTDILSGRPTFTNGDVISVAFDASTGKVWFAKNGTWVNGSSGSAGDPAAGTNEVGSVSTAIQGYVAGGGGYSSATFSINFGQRPFAYTPPSGFLALNTQNLPEPTIKKPGTYMDVVTYTGNGSTLTPTSSLGFSPDLVWIKRRDSTASHGLFDSVRGTTKVLYSNLTNAEATESGVTAFNSNGFTLGSDAGYNGSGNSHVAWCWDESATPGFDIVTYTGNGASSQTLNHSLGVTPAMMITKQRSATGDWFVYHQNANASPQSGGLFLELTNGFTTNSGYWNNTAPTSTQFTVGTAGGLNASGVTAVAYLWSEVANFSKFGSYTGNGSSDGPFCFCGFKARWIMVKRTDTSNNWEVWDTARSTYNVASKYLSPNLSDTEYDFGTTDAVDVNANGFKLRASNNAVNASGGTYVFAAFSESAFKYSLAR